MESKKEKEILSRLNFMVNYGTIKFIAFFIFVVYSTAGFKGIEIFRPYAEILIFIGFVFYAYLLAMFRKQKEDVAKLLKKPSN